MIFDIYIPSLSIIFEYHGYQHYYDHYLFGDTKSCTDRDIEKRAACSYHNISYIEIPYWWQHDQESLIATVHKVRPDLVLDAALDYPFKYPQHARKPTVDIRCQTK